MNELSFRDFDEFLLEKKNRIIHQIWFGLIPNRREAKKALEGLRKHQTSWMDKNPSWTYTCWGFERCKELVKKFYPQHIELYNRYPYHIQRCDAVRYFILHRYGGLYADMDYHCNRSWDIVLNKYPRPLYLVETPNKFYNDAHISNSLMYSTAGHVFWRKMFIELEINRVVPMYYSRHMAIMFTTGPGILNRVFNKYRTRYRLNHYPYALFHPYGLTSDVIITLKSKPEVFAVHLGKGSWEKKDSRIIIFLYQEWKFLLIIISILIVPSLIYYIIAKRLKPSV